MSFFARCRWPISRILRCGHSRPTLTAQPLPKPAILQPRLHQTNPSRIQGPSNRKLIINHSIGHEPKVAEADSPPVGDLPHPRSRPDRPRRLSNDNIPLPPSAHRPPWPWSWSRQPRRPAHRPAATPQCLTATVPSTPVPLANSQQFETSHARHQPDARRHPPLRHQEGPGIGLRQLRAYELQDQDSNTIDNLELVLLSDCATSNSPPRS